MSVMYKAIRMNFYSNAKHHTCTAVCVCAVLHLNQGEASHRKYRIRFSKPTYDHCEIYACSRDH